MRGFTHGPPMPYRSDGRIWQDAAQRMKHKIAAAINADKQKLTTKVGDSIVTKLAKGGVQEAFQHLKDWYQKTVETQARPC
jgi:hypothetical protein